MSVYDLYLSANKELSKLFSQYDPEWLDSFLVAVFGKYRYVHTLSEHGLDMYFSNLREVSKYHPDDAGSVQFLIQTGYEIVTIEGKKVPGVRLYNMIDFKDPDVFVKTFQQYERLKAFL